mmetsp:Transcript_2153/g.5350  ORF Transcript_2153/g.5350 Transcript_2153/m.5350 type:complete len:224 (-) Transcript_2153:762-1433(-)
MVPCDLFVNHISVRPKLNALVHAYGEEVAVLAAVEVARDVLHNHVALAEKHRPPPSALARGDEDRRVEPKLLLLQWLADDVHFAAGEDERARALRPALPELAEQLAPRQRAGFESHAAKAFGPLRAQRAEVYVVLALHAPQSVQRRLARVQGSLEPGGRCRHEFLPVARVRAQFAVTNRPRDPLRHSEAEQVPAGDAAAKDSVVRHRGDPQPARLPVLELSGD